MTLSVENLQVKLFSDGGDLSDMLEMNAKPYIKGLTTNPTLMRKVRIPNYKESTTDILNKLKLLEYELENYSLDTVKMFYTDWCDAGYAIN